MAVARRTETRKLGQVCSDLSDSIENAMHALYNLETATINVIGKSRQYESNLYQTIRQSNKVGWDQIVQHLEHSGQCGREIETLGANFFNAPTPDLLEHAKEIATDSRSLLSESQKILEGHILYLIDFRKPEKHLRTLLEKSHRTRITRPDYNSSYIQTSGARQLIRETRKNMYVDGIEALDAFKKADEDIKNNIFALIEFWQTQSDLCDRVLTEVSDTTNKRQGLTMEEANKISADWKEALPQVKNASDRILKTCDVVMTSAVGAPRARRPHHQSNDSEYPGSSEDTGAGMPSNVAVGAALATSALFFGTMAWERWQSQATTVIQTFGNALNNLGEDIASAIVNGPHQSHDHEPDTSRDTIPPSIPSTRYYQQSYPPRPTVFPRRDYYEPTMTVPGDLDVD